MADSWLHFFFWLIVVGLMNWWNQSSIKARKRSPLHSAAKPPSELLLDLLSHFISSSGMHSHLLNYAFISNFKLWKFEISSELENSELNEEWSSEWSQQEAGKKRKANLTSEWRKIERNQVKQEWMKWKII